MGADQTPDPTAWSDDQLDSLLDVLAKRAAERDDLDLPGRGVSRRSVLATLAGGAGIGYLAGSSEAAGESWSDSTGTVGTDAKPLAAQNVQDLDAKVLEVDKKIQGVADWIVTNREELETIFPPDETTTTPLSDGETVVLAPDDPPINIRRPNYLHGGNADGVTVLGQFTFGAEPELRVADNATSDGNVPAFITRDGTFTFEAISFDGNYQGQGSNTNQAPFLSMWGEPSEVYAGFNFARDIHPHHNHNAGGDMFITPGFAPGPDGFYGYFNQVVNTGDRMFTLQDTDEVVLFGNRSASGFDRMISVFGTHQATIVGNVSGDLAEGSFIGVQGWGTPARGERILIAGNHIEGSFRNGVQVYGFNGTDQRVQDVTIAFNTFRHIDSPTDHWGIETDKPSEYQRRITFIGNTVQGSGFGNGGVMVRSDRFRSAFNSFIDVGTTIYDIDGGTEIDIGYGDRFVNPPSSIVTGASNATRPRFRGVLGGGPLGGVDLSAVSGQFLGDQAIASGASSAAAGSLARWDGSSWDVFAPDSTV